MDGAVITTPTLWVRGTVEGGGDVALSVPLPTGFPLPSLAASAEGGTFALEIPSEGAAPRLTVTATDWATGATVTDTISVAYAPDDTEAAFGFTAAPDGGIAPLVVGFNVNLPREAHALLDIDSNGIIDFEGSTLEGLTFVYDRPGVYLATLRATTGGETATYRASVQVYDPAGIDGRVLAVWAGFSAALRSGDISRATSFIHGNRRARWQEYFGQLTSDELAEEAAAFTNIERVRVGRGGAEYEMLREEDGRIFSYPVVFVADIDGRWRLWQF
jgi:hypothetical protein